MHESLPRRAGLWLFALAAPSLAQTPVLVVDDDGGPGVDFTTIEAAVEAAPAGAIVLVREGDYPGVVTVQTPLSVIADDGANVTTGAFYVFNMNDPAGVVLRGLHASESLIFGFNSGPVWVEDCEVHVEGLVTGPTDADPAITVMGCASVSLLRVVASVGPIVDCLGLECIFGHGGGAALSVNGARVYVFDSDLQGGPGLLTSTELSTRGGAGIFASGAGALVGGTVLYVAGSSLRGGDGGEGVMLGCTTVETPPAGGGYGIWATPEVAAVYVLDTESLGGTEGIVLDGFQGSACGGPPGPTATGLLVPPEVLVPLPGSARGFVASAPTSSGGTTSLEFTGEPGDVVFLAISPGQGLFFDESLLGPVLLAPPSRLILLGLQSPTGQLQFDVQVPPIPAGARVIHAQAVIVDSAAEVRIGEGSVLIWLAPGL